MNLLNGGRRQGDRTDAAPIRVRWQVLAAAVAAIVMCVSLGLFQAEDRNSPPAPSGSYHAYAGHRWHLQLPTSSAGYIELDDAGVFKTYDTAVERFGTYVITGAGQLVVRSTDGVSTGTPQFDQTVVDALATLNRFANNGDRPETMTIHPVSATAFSLDVEGHTLTFFDK